MQTPSPNSPIWVVARASIVGVTLIAFLKYNYNNGWSPNDWNTFLGVLSIMGVFDAVKNFVSGRNQ